MAVERRAAGGSNLIDVLDRVLDKGIVIDAWVRVSLAGIDLITVEARVVVASIETYLKYSEAIGQVGSASQPAVKGRTMKRLAAKELAPKELAPKELAGANPSLQAQFAAYSNGRRRRRHPARV
jgi:gas vesicle structural protein